MPSVAHRKQNSEIIEVALDNVRVDDILVVYPHDICPVDGEVVEGHGVMDESFLTGEPFEITKAAGSTVISGAINGESALTIKATRRPIDSRYAKIMEVMRESEQKRPRLRRLGGAIDQCRTAIFDKTGTLTYGEPKLTEQIVAPAFTQKDHLGPKHQFKRIMIVSGDPKSEVRYLAEQVGITELYAQKSPEEKLAIVRQETAEAKTLYVGDGINDAPAMMAATVGMAVGQNSDVTAEAAGVVALENSLKKVDEFLHVSRRMRFIALQSAVGGMILSMAGMLFAAAGYLSPVAGAIGQEVIDVLAVLNALRAAFPPKVMSAFKNCALTFRRSFLVSQHLHPGMLRLSVPNCCGYAVRERAARLRDELSFAQCAGARLEQPAKPPGDSNRSGHE